MKITVLIIFLLISGVLNAGSIGAPNNASDNDSGNISFAPVEYLQKTALADLPIKVMESSVESALPMVLYISGDGGLNLFSKSFCNYLIQKGIPMVVLDAQKYFWKSKTPEETRADLITIVEAYENVWKRDRFVLIGFSFGASIVPFLANSFPSGVSSRLESSILINPDIRCDFEIHLSDMLNLGTSKGNYDVVKEIRQSDNKRISVYFGSDESMDVRQAFQQTGIKVHIVNGNHHFDDGYEELADTIFKEIKNM